MGLPSGVQWANCNVGAENLTDEGLYFSWGNVEGHAMGDGYDFSQSVYDTTPGAEVNTDLPLDQDAARVNLGSPWRIPSSAEFQELVDNCTTEWTTMNGVNGLLFTSNVNGNKLFFPGAGRYNGTSLVGRGTSGFYSAMNFYTDQAARFLTFGSSVVNPQNGGSRYLGASIRAVIQL